MSMTATMDQGQTDPCAPTGMHDFCFPVNIRDAFTYGDCWALACEIEYSEGLPLAVLLQSAADVDRYNWFHVGNVLPDGRIVDIEGIWTPAMWQWRWASESNGGAPIIVRWDVDHLLDQVETDDIYGEPARVYPEIDQRRWAARIAEKIAETAVLDALAR